MEGPDVKFAEATIDNGKFGTRTIRFETGLLARQASGCALAYLDGETVVLSATAVSAQPKEHFDFFPLTVDVEERSYAAGRIPGSFFRREGRPGTEAILAARLIDRPLRPAFVKGLRNEVQVVATVLAIHPDDAYDVVAINAASMSTQLSGLPFSGPIGGVRISLIDGQWVAFPRYSEEPKATFTMVVAGRIVEDDIAIMMVEAEGGENVVANIAKGGTVPTEEVVAEGLEAAKKFIRVLCEAQADLARQAAKETQEYPLFPSYEDEEYEAVGAQIGDRFAPLHGIIDKHERDDKLNEVTEAIVAELAEQFPEREQPLALAVNAHWKKEMRNRVLTEGIRMDGRTPVEIRTITAEAGILPRVHGSALFQRGETQIMGVTTLNMLKMEQQLDNLSPVTAKRYIHHYNFPPYSTGEVGRVGSPKRREIGHGMLAERALVPVLPAREDFPYAIRQVSEALGSNGSTSMGSVCASTLSLLNAGVPLIAPVAGIAMGLISGEIDGEQRFVALTDILGAEDALGDMDFKVAGTREFVTALQLDTKLDGIPAQVLAAALSQARDARFAILDLIEEAVPEVEEMAETAPRIITVKIPVDKIGEVIGPKGKMINQIQEDTGADISIEDDGTVFIGATNGSAAEAARQTINSIANPQMPEVGERFVGTVVKTATFGAFISLSPGKDGLLHISQIRRLIGGKRVENVEDVLNVGDKVEVELAEIDPRGKLSLHAVLTEEQLEAEKAAEEENKERRGNRERSDRGERGERSERGERGERRERRPRERRRTRSSEQGESAQSNDDSAQETTSEDE
ncbi:polyribonucleotide nucleotidyltransferase [Arcanobacterium pluranimalium]|uniref:polyribonucleotide nucleotidyltransferase n=1 Tax=Arcanobacterium pluranimalium TaxID=108028 RepID=UPI00195B069E|nr:polyribonucleotide nucleotidyltransferase [Arcanobacterium pluranimalium]MBM7825634.1 polyribonucleotide nucleotidyltransferase [Arcanobacterium pluranimalium]